MKNKFAGLIAAIGLFGLVPNIASAGLINFAFGSGGAASSCGAGCLEVNSLGLAVETSGLPGLNVGLFQGSLKFIPGASTWSFSQIGGSNDLFGSFTSALNGNPFQKTGNLFYTVLGGGGLFAGASGYGQSFVSITSFFGKGLFLEHGWMSVLTRPSAEVPEPGMISLFLAGFGMIAYVAYRRRRAQVGL